MITPIFLGFFKGPSDGLTPYWPLEEMDYRVFNHPGGDHLVFLLPIPELISVVEGWDRLVRASLPATAVWYAPIDSSWGEQSFSTADPGETRNHALDRRLKVLYEQVGLPYHSAHKFRHGHAVYGLQHAQTMADYKALSLNLMHQDIKITDQIYAPILNDEVRQRVAGLSNQSAAQQESDLAALIWSIHPGQLPQALSIIAERLSR